MVVALAVGQRQPQDTETKCPFSPYRTHTPRMLPRAPGGHGVQTAEARVRKECGAQCRSTWMIHTPDFRSFQQRPRAVRSSEGPAQTTCTPRGSCLTNGVTAAPALLG